MHLWKQPYDNVIMHDLIDKTRIVLQNVFYRTLLLIPRQNLFLHIRDNRLTLYLHIIKPLRSIIKHYFFSKQSIRFHRSYPFSCPIKRSDNFIIFGITKICNTKITYTVENEFHR